MDRGKRWIVVLLIGAVGGAILAILILQPRVSVHRQLVKREPGVASFIGAGVSAEELDQFLRARPRTASTVASDFPIHHVVGLGRVDLLEVLLRHGHDANEPWPLNPPLPPSRPLLIAIRDKNAEMIRALASTVQALSGRTREQNRLWRGRG